MSANFCILIPSKVFQVKKRFSEKLQAWIGAQTDASYPDPPNHNSSWPRWPNNSLVPLSEFRSRPDVHLDLPEKLYSRYHVMDWGFEFPPPHILQFFLSWLAEVYPYGEVGLLKYWSAKSRRHPPIALGNIEESISNVSARELPLDRLLFFPLTSYSS